MKQLRSTMCIKGNCSSWKDSNLFFHCFIIYWRAKRRFPDLLTDLRVWMKIAAPSSRQKAAPPSCLSCVFARNNNRDNQNKPLDEMVSSFPCDLLPLAFFLPSSLLLIPQSSPLPSMHLLDCFSCLSFSPSAPWLSSLLPFLSSSSPPPDLYYPYSALKIIPLHSNAPPHHCSFGRQCRMRLWEVRLHRWK